MIVGNLNRRTRANEGFKLVLKHPETGDPLDAVVYVLGEDSDKYRAARTELQRLLKDVEDPSEDLYAEHGARLLAVLVTGWENFDDENGDPITFTPEQAYEFLRDPGYDWMASQIREAVGNRENFTLKPANG